jgi:hypothetical protein
MLILQERAELHAGQAGGQPDEALRSIMFTAQRLGRERGLTPLAWTAAEAGLHREAVSMLELGRRRSSAPDDQFHLAVNTLALTLEGQAEGTPPSSAPDMLDHRLKTVLRAHKTTQEDVALLTKTLGDHAGVLRPVWQLIRSDAVENRATNRSVAALVDAVVAGGDAADVVRSEGADPALVAGVVTFLLESGDPEAAAEVWRAVEDAPLGPTAVLDEPVHIAVADAVGDHAGLLGFVSEAMRTPLRHRGANALLPDALARCGKTGWARDLYRRFWDELIGQSRTSLRRNKQFPDFVDAYLLFLVGDGQVRKAEEAAAFASEIDPGTAAARIYQLHRSAVERGDGTPLEDRLRRMFLVGGVAEQVRNLEQAAEKKSLAAGDGGTR